MDHETRREEIETYDLLSGGRESLLYNYWSQARTTVGGKSFGKTEINLNVRRQRRDVQRRVAASGKRGLSLLSGAAMFDSGKRGLSLLSGAAMFDS